jgi:hypothetical protein
MAKLEATINLLHLPEVMRTQAMMQEVMPVVSDMMHDHDACAQVRGIKCCPCRFCRAVRAWVTPVAAGTIQFCASINENEPPT